MSGAWKTRDFFESGSVSQFEWVLRHYDQALRLKAESKSSKPENVIKLDKWYQTELPKKIKARGKEAHLIHDELVQTIKWKLARGKNQANILNLIQMNTPRVVQAETRKAFRNLFKKGDLQAASAALCNLKGVGPTMASAVLAAGAPHLAPFMADECLLAMPDGESLDYTMKEYMRFVEYVQKCVDRLNSQGGSDWTPHKVELAVWTHYVINDLKPEVLADIPDNKKVVSHMASATSVHSESSNGVENGGCIEEDKESSMANKVSSVEASGQEDSTSSFASSSPTPMPEKQNGNGFLDSNDEATNGQPEDTAATNGDKVQPNGTNEATLARVSEQPVDGSTLNCDHASPSKMPSSSCCSSSPTPATTTPALPACEQVVAADGQAAVPETSHPEPLQASHEHSDGDTLKRSASSSDLEDSVTKKLKGDN